ncbi:hypothetical protein DES54_1221, partial [Brenneria salicis ATCC 15712 = DSM 30166]
MKRRNPHIVYLSRQMLDIFVALHTCASGSRFVLPSRYDGHRSMSHATLNRVTVLVVQRAQANGLPLEPFARKPVGWAMSFSPDSRLTTKALEMAFENRG